MTKDKSCTELISDDIVRIDIIKSTQSTVPIPVTIPLNPSFRRNLIRAIQLSH